MIEGYTYVVHMKLVWIGITIVGLIFLTGCVGGGLFDCGSNIQCFKERAANCEPTLLTITNSTEIGIGTMSMTTRAEIRGGTLEECTFYMKIEDISISGNLTPTQQQLFESMMGILEGKDMTCIVSTAQISGKTPSTGMADPNACSGSLLDVVGELGGTFTP